MVESPDGKRRVPKSLQRVLQIDKVVTKKFCDGMEKLLPYTKYRKHYKFLEYTCHALPWFFASIASLWLLWNEELFQTQVNLLFALSLDCIVVAVAKAAVRRRRPAGNRDDMFLAIGPDAYSFPSGHVSRAVMLSFFAAFPVGTNVVVVALALAWSSAVAVSRVLMKRHHILDVLGGVVVGLVEGWLVSQIWLSRSTAIWVVNYLSDDPVDLEGLRDGGMEVDDD